MFLTDSVSLQAADHEEVFQKTNKQITAFISNDEVAKKRAFYMKLVGCMVNVHLRQLCTLADQPERRNLTATAAGNGLFTGRWGFSANLYALWKVLKPCKACRDKMFLELTTKPNERIWDLGMCEECTRWEIDIDSPLLNLPVDGTKYPSDAFEGNIIKPFRYVLIQES